MDIHTHTDTHAQLRRWHKIIYRTCSILNESCRGHVTVTSRSHRMNDLSHMHVTHMSHTWRMPYTQKSRFTRINELIDASTSWMSKTCDMKEEAHWYEWGMSSLMWMRNELIDMNEEWAHWLGKTYDMNEEANITFLLRSSLIWMRNEPIDWMRKKCDITHWRCVTRCVTHLNTCVTHFDITRVILHTQGGWHDSFRMCDLTWRTCVTLTWLTEDDVWHDSFTW